MTSEPDFYRKLFQTKFRGDDTKTFQIFGVPIGNAKITRKVQFQPVAPVIKCHQKTFIASCLRLGPFQEVPFTIILWYVAKTIYLL